MRGLPVLCDALCAPPTVHRVNPQGNCPTQADPETVLPHPVEILVVTVMLVRVFLVRVDTF
jgi:hypothetical protein